MEDHLDNGDKKYGRESDGTGHGIVISCPEVAQAWVSERDECRGEKMDEGRCDEHTSTEVTNGKEKSGRNAQTGDLFGEDRKNASERRDKPNDNHSTSVQRGVVGVFIMHTTRCTSRSAFADTHCGGGRLFLLGRSQDGGLVGRTESMKEG